jgi:hypothetical protein
MKNLLISFALFVATTTACAKDAPPPEPSGGTAVAPIPEPPSAEPLQCQGDSDCIISCAQQGECCDQLCPPCNQAFHRDALAAHEQWRTASCAATSCPVAKCMAPTEETVARCAGGQCVVERRPIGATTP